VKHILLTHGHFDHVGAAAELAKMFDISSLVHKADVRLLRQAPLYSLRYGNRIMAVPDRYTPCDEDPGIAIGGNSVVALPTPGHTPGGVSYCFDKFIFTGDTLLKGYIGRTDQPGADESAIKESIGTLLKMLDVDVVIFPGHGKPWVISEARLWWEEAFSAPLKHDTFIH
jgi:glyoxylase-like metal-dependent hydrolase (beta-lactamase superfamily II)